MSLPWVTFGHGGHETPPDAPLPFAYDKQAQDHDGVLIHYKIIANPCDILLLRTHKIQTRTHARESVKDLGVAAQNYRTRKEDVFRSVASLQLNRYFLRSKSEFRAKIQQGNITTTKPEKVPAHRLSLAKQIESNTVVDRTAIDFLERKGISSAEAFLAYGAEPASI